MGSHGKYGVSFVEYYYGNDKPYITSIKIRDNASKPSRDIHLLHRAVIFSDSAHPDMQHTAHSPAQVTG